ncbi:hypothetical protein FE257_008206 [Aspergillus nanangensis]|uniref:Zn(2)-C6 fungal-type domain-containing protein n=1 Tax=Aspergillus nanangensis TaxID=2582783 RepID=A0AAD4GTM0_ASPNN|nr:hypothetical protein FE257_008206 [Aspergillus nanangensis]
MTVTRNRHCWECLGRSLVCDFGRPQCKRCVASGIDCPGYGDVKPVRLKWLAPGRVKSRKDKSKKSDPTTSTEITQAVTTPNGVANPPKELQTDFHAFVQATEYYNTCIFPDLVSNLGQNASVCPITPPIFQMAIATHPDYIRLVIVCMTLSHRINRSRDDAACPTLARSFFHYRGQLIRSLRDDF